MPAAASAPAAAVTAAEFQALVREAVPMTRILRPEVERLEDGFVRIRAPFDPDFLRPGGTVSGPVLMALADITMYGLVMSRAGAVELAVTTHLNMAFLRRPAAAAVIAEGRLLRMGRRLAFGDVLLYSEGIADPVAQASVTYAMPSEA